jgi:hypothetical protein
MNFVCGITASLQAARMTRVSWLAPLSKRSTAKHVSMPFDKLTNEPRRGEIVAGASGARCGSKRLTG